MNLEKLWQVAIDAAIPLEQLYSTDGTPSGIGYVLSGSATPQNYTDMDNLIADPDNYTDLIEDLFNISQAQLINKAINRRDQIQTWLDDTDDWSDMTTADQDQFMEWLFQQQLYFYVLLLYEAGVYE